jgi:hypothetical protein
LNDIFKFLKEDIDNQYDEVPPVTEKASQPIAVPAASLQQSAIPISQEVKAAAEIRTKEAAKPSPKREPSPAKQPAPIASPGRPATAQAPIGTAPAVAPVEAPKEVVKPPVKKEEVKPAPVEKPASPSKEPRKEAPKPAQPAAPAKPASDAKPAERVPSGPAVPKTWATLAAVNSEKFQDKLAPATGSVVAVQHAQPANSSREKQPGNQRPQTARQEKPREQPQQQQQPLDTSEKDAANGFKQVPRYGFWFTDVIFNY